MPIHRRLALYSDQEPPHHSGLDQRLLQLIGTPRPRIGYVAAEPDPQRYFFQRKREDYAALGAELVLYVDADSSAQAWVSLLQCQAIHLSGGNTFFFLDWLRRQGRLPELARYAGEGGVLIGVSAGAILMTPGIASAALCGDERMEGCSDDSGLALVDFHFWPHFGPGPVGDGTSLPAGNVYGCPDGSGIIVDGERIELFGQVRMIGHS